MNDETTTEELWELLKTRPSGCKSITSHVTFTTSTTTEMELTFRSIISFTPVKYGFVKLRYSKRI